MTPEDLDRWAAEKLMGWQSVDIAGVKYWKGFISKYDETGITSFQDLWHPTEDLNQAFMCIEKVPDCYAIHVFWGVLHKRYGVKVQKYGVLQSEVYDPDPATAIIKAIYAALEGKP